jgi:hypothetical protein
MIVSTSNIAPSGTFAVVPASSTQTIDVVRDGDYSSVYTDVLSGLLTITITFSDVVNIGYIAIGGSNISKKDLLRIEFNGATTPEYWQTVSSEQLVSSIGEDLAVTLGGTVHDNLLGLSESRVMMYQVDVSNVKTITMHIKGSGDISIAEIAMGDYYEIPNGEQAGYRRPWSVPNIKSRSSVGLDNSPVNLSYESRPLKTSISVPNNIMRNYESDWYKFIEFAANNTFYVSEDFDRLHSYAGFNAVPAMTSAHSQTRTLGVQSITFSAFAKSTEALF